MKQEAAERVDVRAGARLRALDLLRGDEVDGPDELACPSQPAVGADLLRQPEVAQIGVVLVAALDDQHVRGLDVAVHEPAAMSRVERGGNLAHKMHGAL